MKKIPLDRKKFAIVDDEDYEYLQWFTWRIDRNSYGYNYASRTIMTDSKSKKDKMHRIIMKITDPNVFVDHIDGDCLNNQKSNLRLANRSQNAANKHRVRGKSKYLGVYSTVQFGIHYWKAVCKKSGKTEQRYHALEGEAAVSYNEMAEKLHGEFAKLNILTAEHLKEIEELKTKKRCGRCKEYKETIEFNKSKSTSTGLSSYCRHCLKKEWEKTDKGKAKQRNRKATKRYRDKKKLRKSGQLEI